MNVKNRNILLCCLTIRTCCSPWMVWPDVTMVVSGSTERQCSVLTRLGAAEGGEYTCTVWLITSLVSRCSPGAGWCRSLVSPPHQCCCCWGHDTAPGPGAPPGPLWSPPGWGQSSGAAGRGHWEGSQQGRCGSRSSGGRRACAGSWYQFSWPGPRLRGDPDIRGQIVSSENLKISEYLYRDPLLPGLVTVHVNVPLQVELCGETFGTTVAIVDGFVTAGVPLVLVHTRVGLQQERYKDFWLAEHPKLLIGHYHLADYNWRSGDWSCNSGRRGQHWKVGHDTCLFHAERSDSGTNKLKCRKNAHWVLTWQKPPHFGTYNSG